MPDDPAPTVTVRFWAGARRAAGHETEQVAATTVEELRVRLAARPELRPVVAVASILVDGQQAGETTILPAGAQVDVLPPFAGGAVTPLVVGLGGSAGADSVTSRLLERCLDRLRQLGARTEAILGPELAGLPIYDGQTPATVSRLVDAVRRADCVVIATPGYHGGMSGLVKNALDHLEALRDDGRPYLDGRAVGVCVTAAGWQACGTTLSSVRAAIHALRGWPTPFGVTMNSVEQDLDDPAVGGALDILAGQLIRFAGWQLSGSGR